MDEAKQNDKIIPRVIEDEMKQSYLDYSMSVIVGRALPDIRDGLKPVHRRILFAMQQMGMVHNKPFKKSARIVGEVLGKYHPHGDLSVYDALVRMTQSFSLRYPLIQGQGNFGSVDGDRAAAMRYTEARLNKLSEESLQDIEKETVEFIPNFDGSLEEPVFLPSKVPNLLINGSSGIAVGMATNIPPHNLNEINDAIIRLIDNPEADEELLDIVKGPDFPTAGIILGKQGIKDAYKTGRGKVKIRARVKIEDRKIIITEIPYMTNKSALLEQIADLVKDGKIRGISDIRDETSRDEIRAIIYLKKDANTDIILNQLYKHTRMQQTFGIIMLALVDNEPKVLNLKSVLQHYLIHRRLMVRKRTEYDLKKSEKKAHILEGLIIALNNIDKAVELVKQSKSAQEAKDKLISNFKLTLEQAQAILDMKLQKLTGLEQEKIKTEHSELIKLIVELKEILGDESRILRIIKDELNELKERYGDERRTEITEGEVSSFEMEELIKPENMVVTISHSGYIKRQPVTTYKAQKRGGKGVIGAAAKEEDFIEDLFIANTHSYMLFFTNKGRVHWLKVYEIPEGTRQARGKSIVNLLRLGEGETISTYVPVKSFEGFLVMATKKGIVKKTALEEFSRPRKGGIIAISLKNNDELIHVCKTTGENKLIIATRNGIAVKFSEKDVRNMGRSAAGVRGIRLKNEDYVIGMVLAKDDRTLLTITGKGYGKKTPILEYRLINRGGSGVINIKCTDKNGKVVEVKSVTDKDELILISKKGIIIRVAVKDISTIGRATQGVKVMKLSEGDEVVSIARVIKQ